ncbi:MAG: heterocyst frequency control protein PatD [Microcystaceae cyanobacterium]
MLPQLHTQAYQQLLDALLTLQQLATETEPDVQALQERFELVQHVFQGQIMGLSVEELQPSILVKWQSVRTEIHRALRLLGTEMLFLRSAKDVATYQRRLVTLRDRLAQLIGYAQVMIESE